jgi:hypothetical protein
MTRPKLTFFCELEADELESLFADSAVLKNLEALDAAVSLGLIDLCDKRAGVVRRLNAAGIPVIAWLLLPKEQGYWFNIGNPAQASARYAEFERWTAQHGLGWDGIGLDIETDIREMRLVAVDRQRLIPVLLCRLWNVGKLRQAQMAYVALAARIRTAGYRVDSYQMPLIVDERQVGSTLIQRLFALVDLPVDREVLMLYSSFYRPRGAGVLWSYGRGAQSVGLGVTGGGVQIADVVQPPFLDWEEFARDLRLAKRCTDDIHIFSLEGCVQQGFLQQLLGFDWESPVTPSAATVAEVQRLRTALGIVLSASAHPWLASLGLIGVLCLLRRRRK